MVVMTNIQNILIKSNYLITGRSMDNQSSGFSVRSNTETTDNISDEIRKGIRVCCLKAFDAIGFVPGRVGNCRVFQS